MKKILIVLTLLIASYVELFSQGSTYSIKSTSSNQESVSNDNVYPDNYLEVVESIRHGSEDPEDIRLVLCLEDYLVEHWYEIFGLNPVSNKPRFVEGMIRMVKESWRELDDTPQRVIWRWSYDSLQVDTLSVINKDILSLLDYYDGKSGPYDDCNVWHQRLEGDIDISTYRKYYTLRIDTLCCETVIYYSLNNEPIEDIFSDPQKMEQFGHVMGYINYDGRPILVSGSGADQFFKRDSTIVMSPTYRTRVERDGYIPFSLKPYLIGEIKGFFLYRDGGFMLCRTSFVPFWQDREFYLDGVGQRIENSFGSFLPYRVVAPVLSPDVLKRYRTREPLQ